MKFFEAINLYLQKITKKNWLTRVIISFGKEYMQNNMKKLVLNYFYYF